jgi:hypothetical protein
MPAGKQRRVPKTMPPVIRSTAKSRRAVPGPPIPVIRHEWTAGRIACFGWPRRHMSFFLLDPDDARWDRSRSSMVKWSGRLHIFQAGMAGIRVRQYSEVASCNQPLKCSDSP